jgi:hypothetical protein
LPEAIRASASAAAFIARGFNAGTTREGCIEPNPTSHQCVARSQLDGACGGAAGRPTVKLFNKFYQAREKSQPRIGILSQ